MFLKSLQIQGFKSFPDKIKLSFENGITATVGPNGSGKSNISDAVRWVLGEQAPSALRIKSMEDIIFEGTNLRKAAGFAEVILTINNTGRWLSYDAEEVSISRRYYRSGTSEYRINGKPALLRDINELFMDTGIGKDGYSMIGQGKISDIVEVRANDRRIIFEEAAGISKYRYRKQEAERNLDKTNDNLVHLDVILSELEARVGPLEKESEKAKRAIELGEECKREEIGLWLYTLSRSTGVLRDQDYKITLLNEQYNTISRSIEELDAQIDELYGESNRLLAYKDEQIRAASAMDEQAARLSGEADVITAQIEHDNADIRRIDSEIAESQGSKEQLLETIAQKEALLLEKKEEIEKHSHEIEALQKQIEGLRLDEGDISLQLARFYEKQNTLTVGLSEQQLRVARAQSQLDEIENRSVSIDEIISAREQRIEQLTGEQRETREALGIAKGKLDELNNSITGHRMRLDSQRRKADEAKSAADSLRLDSQDKARKANTIEDLEKSLEGYDYSVRKVIQHAQSGGLRGVHGPVSRVIDVDSKYAIAIETALGASIKNIIVENENDGKMAMEFLKQNKGGRATFLPISVIRARAMEERGLDECAGFVEIASRLVRCDAKYREIIENLLGRVCVVEDMDSAIAVAKRYKNRFRIVTLDGQVINAGGSMTGGSNDKNIGLLTRKGELERLRAEAQRLSEQAQEAAVNAERLKQKAASEEAALLAAQSELTCVNEDRLSFELELKRIDEQLSQNRRELDSLLSEKSGNSERISALLTEKSDAAKLIEELNTDITANNESIALHSGSADKLAAEREELTSRLNGAGLAHISLVKEAEAVSDSINEINARLNQGGDRESELTESIKLLKLHIEELTGKQAEINTRASELRSDAKNANANAFEVEGKRDSIEISIRQKREESRLISEQRESVSNEKNRLEERMAQTQKEYDGIIQRLMETYNLTRKEAELQYEPCENERLAQKKVSELHSSIRSLGSVNMSAIEEYQQISERYNTYKTQIDDVVRSKGELERMISELTLKMQEIFLQAFNDINRNFTEIFPELFGGGSARLVLLDEEDCLNCGIDIEVTPPGKEMRSIIGMSGGEKSLIATAIYFAIMKVRPSPFCFLDEVDHALDESNVVNLARYIKRFVGSTQYIVTTHRRGMMEAADMLYGVTKQDGISRLIELKLDEVEEKLGKIN